MSIRTLLQVTDTMYMEDAFYQIEPCKPMMLLIQILIRTTTQLMEQILPLYHLPTHMYSSKMERNIAQMNLIK